MRSTETRALRVPEEKLARAGALGSVAVAPAVGLVVAVTDGVPGGVTAAAGAALVALLALSATPLYRLGSRGGNDAVIAMAMAALGQRLMLGVAAFAGLWRFTDIPMTSFAVGLAAGLVASIVAEMVAAARDPRFFWVSTPPSSGTERQHA